MSKIYVVMGKSSSGKDTIYKMLLEDKELKLNTITVYTTRPMRDGEVEGREYHFVDEKRMLELEAAGKVVERRSYNTVHGIWNYFTVDDEQIDLEDKDYILIGTLESYVKIRDYYGKDVVSPIYVEVDDGDRLIRAISREKQQDNPKYEEMCRRFLADAKDFSEDKIKECDITKRYTKKFEGIDIIKFVSPHPKDFSDELIEVIKNSKKIARQISSFW